MNAPKEPKAVAEIHRIREQMQHEEDREGSDKYFDRLNKRKGSLLRKTGKPRGSAAVVRERAVKRYGEKDKESENKKR